MLLTIYAIAMVVAWAALAAYLVIGSGKIRYLRTVNAAGADSLPPVAVIIPVRNEEAEVEQALMSVCRLDYPQLSIVVINDRSTDTTPVILDHIAAAEPKLQVIHISELPSGWLGKNHALQKGYESTSEEWLLFTDADVVFSPGSLKKAMRYAQQNGLDHLSALPEVCSRSRLFRAVMNTFALMLDIKIRPWEVRNPSSPSSIGIGAFNLLKRSAYEKAGTHRAISLRPDDDLKLGERIKAAGLKQDVVYGEGELQLEWYTSLPAFIQGLMKNTFSVSDYKLPLAIGTALSAFLLLVLPVPLLLLSGHPYYLGGIAILIFQLALMLLKKGIKGSAWHGILVPFAGLVMVYIIIVSALRTLKQGGIYWRGSFYPLSELRKQS